MIAVIRIKGEIHTPQDVRETMRFLRLENTNHMVLLDDSAQTRGMLFKVVHLIAFGNIDAPTLAHVLEKRGRLPGNKRIGKEVLSKAGVSDFAGLSEQILKKPAEMERLHIKPVFRLHPPRKGFARVGIKKSYSVGGVWGDQKEAINQLIQKMS